MSGMDDDLERQLSERMRRVDAPAHLADAVMKRAAGQPRRLVALPRSYPQMWRLAALFLLTALLCGAVAETIHHRRAAERARAERDFAKSQELTSRALEPVRRHLRRAGLALDE